MALFAYRAVDAEGRISAGSLDAANMIDLELRLRRLGLDLIAAESVKRGKAARTRRVTRPELITFCFHLSQLLNAGVSIIEALTDLRDSIENPGFRQVVAGLLEDIGGGQKLSRRWRAIRTASIPCSWRWCAWASKAGSSPKCSTSSPTTSSGRTRSPRRRGAR
jgi:type II secretory pathway component PulF